MYNIQDFVNKAINLNPTAVQNYKNGKKIALKFLVGQVMRLSKGCANPEQVKEALVKILT